MSREGRSKALDALPKEEGASFAWNGEVFLVVWEDYRKAESDPDRYDADIYGTIVGEREACDGEESSARGR